MLKLINYGIQQVFRRPIRTILTSLGVMISVILLSFIIFGMRSLNDLIDNEFSTRFKETQITVQKGGAFGGFIGVGNQTKSDVDEDKIEVITPKIVNEIENREYVVEVIPVAVATFEIKLEGESVAYTNGVVGGANLKDMNKFVDSTTVKEDGKIRTYEREDNEFIGSPGDKKVYVSKSLVEFYETDTQSVLGKKLILEPASGGTNVTIGSNTGGALSNKESKRFEIEIVGVTEDQSSGLAAFFSEDYLLDIILETKNMEESQRDEYLDSEGYFELLVEVDSKDNVVEVKEWIKEKYGLNAQDLEDFLSLFDTITGGLTIALSLFAGISSLVAAIGIINTMIMSIYEQTREIGVIKALGASNLQVLTIFLIQSGAIGLLGGIMGLGFSYGVMKLSDPFVVQLLEGQGFTLESFFSFDWQFALLIALVSIIVGVVAGIYPSMRAARLDPAKALRYE